MARAQIKNRLDNFVGLLNSCPMMLKKAVEGCASLEYAA
jgi:hypothetical protein